MEIYFFIIPIGVVFVFFAVRALIWAIKNGQYDNLETEAHRILFDEDDLPEPERSIHSDEKAKPLAPNNPQEPR